jgi:hypothetical protein
MKYIREGRFGAPKSFKTGAIVGTYPKPMLVFEFNEGGLDVIPTKPEPAGANRIQMDCIQNDITYIDPVALEAACKTSPDKQPKITCLDFSKFKAHAISEKYGFEGEKQGFQTFIDSFNKIVKNGCPWKTIVLDPTTDLIEMIIAHMTQTNKAAMETKGSFDPRHWAPMAAGKLQQIMTAMNSLPCHTVYIMHSVTTENETTKEIRTTPMIVSQFRDRIGGCLSQFFYSTKEGEKPVIYTTDKGFVKGIGCRWPSNLPAVCGADFNSIYGKEQL